MASDNGSKVDLKVMALILSVGAAIGSPFIAVGGYKEKISFLSKTAEAHELKINTIIQTENQKDIQIEGRLARIETLLERIAEKP